MKTFRKWFLVTFAVQIVLIVLTMFTGIGETLIVLYWLPGMMLAVVLHLPEQNGMGAIPLMMLVLAVVIAFYSALAALLAMGITRLVRYFKNNSSS